MPADKWPEHTAFRRACRIQNQFPYLPFCRQSLHSPGAAVPDTRYSPKWDWCPAYCRRKQPRGCRDRQYSTSHWRQGSVCPASPPASPDRKGTPRSSIWYSSELFPGRRCAARFSGTLQERSPRRSFPHWRSHRQWSVPANLHPGFYSALRCPWAGQSWIDREDIAWTAHPHIGDLQDRASLRRAGTFGNTAGWTHQAQSNGKAPWTPQMRTDRSQTPHSVHLNRSQAHRTAALHWSRWCRCRNPARHGESWCTSPSPWPPGSHRKRDRPCLLFLRLLRWSHHAKPARFAGGNSSYLQSWWR